MEICGMAVIERQAADTVQQNQVEVRNPITGALVGSVPTMERDEVVAAAERARSAQPAWEVLGVKARGRLLSRWADMLWKAREKTVQLIRDETGKTDASALVEVVIIDNLVDYYANRAPRLLRSQRRKALFPIIQQAEVIYKPHGVVGFITPWNYPLLNAFVDLVPALIAGNTALMKPSELTPFTALYAVDMMREAGIPDDVVQVVTGAGATGEVLIDSSDYVAFTGSTATGRKVALRCAERLVPCSLELGGKDPMIVLEDADLDLAAAHALRAGMENAGQTCISVERVYVVEPVHEAFLERVRHYAGQLMCSADGGFDVHMGSLTHERELRRTEAHIADAIANGAQLFHGGESRPQLGPCFHEPTVLTNVDHSMLVMQEETFGPILPIMKVKNEAEAIRMANDSAYGLSAAVYTRDLNRGRRVARQLICGDVTVNRAQMVFGTPALPMGGRKESGIGRRGGPEGLMRFVVPQSILIDRMLIKSNALSHMEPTLWRMIRLQRSLRRYIPFLRS
jgi:succinate-semialdehyde dehydrogenase / glutarate-semialdehyde dehydrogenase